MLKPFTELFAYPRTLSPPRRTEGRIEVYVEKVGGSFCTCIELIEISRQKKGVTRIKPDAEIFCFSFTLCRRLGRTNSI